MDITEFRKEKFNKDNLLLDNNTLKSLLDMFDNNLKISSNKIKYVNILKTGKIQQNKDTISNKVNLILNKLSENNINNLIIEFISSINQVNNNEFNEILKTFYIKIISEISFIKIYLDFFKKITYLYEKVQNYNISYFINIIEIKFKLDYSNYNLNDDIFNFLLNFQDEDKRINNLILIKNLIDNNLLSSDLFNECISILLNQDKYIIDIYKWLEITKIKLDDLSMIKINKILNSDNIKPRDKILLESVINNDILDIFKLECYNIINSDIDNISLFIKNKCKDSITKNKFCLNLFSYYMSNNNNNIFNILDSLLSINIILKSNINKGFNLLKVNNEESLINEYSNIKKYLEKL